MMEEKQLSILVPEVALETLHKRYLQAGLLPVDFDVTSMSLIYRSVEIEGVVEAHSKFLTVLDKYINLEVGGPHEHS